MLRRHFVTQKISKKNLRRVHLAEQDTCSDFGVSIALINQGYLEQSKWYFVNVERANSADKLQARNINISFNNNYAGFNECDSVHI